MSDQHIIILTFFARQDVLSYFYLDTCWSSRASQGSFHISFLTCIQWTPVNSIIIQLYDQLFLFCSDLIIKNLEALRFNSHKRSYLMWLVLSSSPYETSFYLTDLSGNRKKKFKQIQSRSCTHSKGQLSQIYILCHKNFLKSILCVTRD